MASEGDRVPPVRGVGHNIPPVAMRAPSADARRPVIVRSPSRTGRRHRDDEKEQAVIDVYGLWAGPQASRGEQGNRAEPMDPLPIERPTAHIEVRMPAVEESHAVLAVQAAVVACLSMLALGAMLAMAVSGS